MSNYVNLRHAPIQDRANSRVAAIMSAAETAINTLGRDSFTTKDVADLAGCSIGTVYRYFPDRVALLDVVYPDRDDAQKKLNWIRTYIEEYVRVKGEEVKFSAKEILRMI